jgi:hypothetical protein
MTPRKEQKAGSVMEGDKLLQRYPSPDGKRWVDLYERRDGLFYFREFYEARDDIPDYGTELYTSPGWESGLYQRVEEAESDLQKIAPWLHENSN